MLQYIVSRIITDIIIFKQVLRTCAFILYIMRVRVRVCVYNITMFYRREDHNIEHILFFIYYYNIYLYTNAECM